VGRLGHTSTDIWCNRGAHMRGCTLHATVALWCWLFAVDKEYTEGAVTC
jgi:hypothetical protein